MNKRFTLGSICKDLGITHGKGKKPDIDYLIFCLNTPEHCDILKNKGLDLSDKNTKRLIPFSAAEYILNSVFKQNKSE